MRRAGLQDAGAAAVAPIPYPLSNMTIAMRDQGANGSGYEGNDALELWSANAGLGALSPTFSRDSDATIIRNNGLTFEENVTNLLTYSEEFDNAAWAKATGLTVSPNVVIAPDGTTTADNLIESTSNITQHVYNTYASFTSGVIYTVSIYAKAKERDVIQIRCNGSASHPSINVNLTSGTITQVNGTPIDYGVESIGNGWYRCWVTFTALVTGSYGGQYIMQTSDTAASQAAYTGDGISGLYVWGAQLEESSVLHGYVPTESTTATLTERTSRATNPDGSGGVQSEMVESGGVFHSYKTTNLLTYSEQFDNASWTKTRSSITADAAQAPDGTTTADKFVEDLSVSNSHVVQKNLTHTATQKTYSLYAKAGERDWINLVWTDGTSTEYNWFNVSTGIAGTTQTSSYGIEAVGDGWYRCWITFTPLAAGGNTSLRLATGNFVQTYDGDGVSGVYIWGAQLTESSVPETYVPTTSAAATAYEARVNEHGILIEGASTNLQVYSEEFDNAAWSKASLTISADQISSPDGKLSADKLVESSGSVSPYLYDNLAMTGTYTLSVFVKSSGDARYLIIRPYKASSDWEAIIIDPDTGTISSSQSGPSSNFTSVSNGIEEIGNGWYRAYISFTVTGGLNWLIALTDDSTVTLSSTSGVDTYTGDGSSGLYIWGAQAEELAFPSSYIPTAGSTVTRAADSLTYDLSSASWFNDGGAGTIVLDFYQPILTEAGTIRYFVEIHDGTSANRYVLYKKNTTQDDIAIYMNTGGVPQVSGVSFSAGITEGIPQKIAYAWDTNDAVGFSNGTQQASDTSCTLPSGLTTLLIGIDLTNGGNAMYAYIKNLKYFPYRVSNADLARLTA